MENSSTNQENLVYIIVVGFILIVGIGGAIFWIHNIQANQAVSELVGSFNANNETSQAAFTRVRLTPTPTVDPDAATAEAALSQVIAAINKGDCIACHTIPGIPNAVGQVGPNLSQIGVEGATRRAGLSAEAYIRESVLDPNAFIAPKCPTGACPSGVMPTVPLDTPEIETIVSYLATLGHDN